MGKKRILYNNLAYEESEEKIELKIITKFPEKWLLIDLENLKCYRGTKKSEIGLQWEKYNNTLLNDIVTFIKTKNQENE